MRAFQVVREARIQAAVDEGAFRGEEPGTFGESHERLWRTQPPEPPGRLHQRLDVVPCLSRMARP